MDHVLRPAESRHDGKPWVPWDRGNEYLASLPGHRERLELSCWYNRPKQSLVMTITQYDESMGEYVPTWAQLALVDVGPFFAQAELEELMYLFGKAVTEAFGLHCPPD